MLKRIHNPAKHIVSRNYLTAFSPYTAWKVSVFRIILVCIFPNLDWILRDTPYLSLFSPNAGKHGPEKFRRRTLLCCVKYSRKTIHVRYLTRFWIRLCRGQNILANAWILFLEIHCFINKNALKLKIKISKN